MCTPETETRLSSHEAYSSWYNSTKTRLDDLTEISDIVTLQQLESDILSTHSCLQEKSTDVRNIANKIQEAQAEIIHLQTEITRQQEHSNISKERLRYGTPSERPVSYYESWFPVNRPARPMTLILLITATVFMIIFSALLILSIMGIRLNMDLLGQGAAGIYWVGLVNFVRAQGWAFWILTAAFLGLLAYVIIRERAPKKTD